MASKITEGFSLVSGAGSGIRKNTAFSVAESGATGTLFADINLQGAQEAATKSKKYASNPQYRALAIHVDVSSEESVQAMVDAAILEFGRVDYYVYRAGVCRSRTSYTVTHIEVNQCVRPQDWDIDPD